MSDISTDAIEQYRDTRRATAPVAANRDLALLHAMFRWGASKKRRLVSDNPFRDGDLPAVRGISKRTERSRRLEPGEAEALLAACGPHLRAVVEAALETGCRCGELFSLQWSQVQSHGLWLPAQKTKTKQARTVPISTRLQSILDRRHDPDGEEHPPEAFVFGTETGEKLTTAKRAWERAVLVSHGHKPAYVTRPAKRQGGKPVPTGTLTRESRAQLKAINLHFHDLRREAGSRWQDAGVTLQTIRTWLGHSNISQTSTYLASTSRSSQDAMREYDRVRALQKIATDPETHGIQQPQSAETEDTKTSSASTILH